MKRTLILVLAAAWASSCASAACAELVPAELRYSNVDCTADTRPLRTSAMT